MICICEPTPAPVLPAYTCGRRRVGGEICGATLRAVPSADRRDWMYVDETGSATLDETPPELQADPGKWWADLAERNIAVYSTHKAAVLLQCFSWWHLHSPARVDHDYGPVPTTCRQPMWAGPDGWVCRVHGTVFPYALP